MKENLHFHNKLTNIKLLIYIFLSISLLTVDNRTKFSEKVRYYTSTIVTPIYYLSSVPLHIYESIDDYFSGTKFKKIIKFITNTLYGIVFFSIIIFIIKFTF